MVLINRVDYAERVKRLLSDASKFKEIIAELRKKINLLLQYEGKSIYLLEQVKNSITADLYKHLYSQGFQPGIMYGLFKIHKPLVNGFPELRLILFAINTGTYKCANFLFFYLNRIFSNDYTVQDSFDFSKNISQQNSKLFMVSLDADYLCTNVSLGETIDICVKELFKTSQTVSGLNQQQVTEMPSVTAKENFISFDEHYYSQIDGVAMGSLFGSTLAKIFQ